MPGNALFSNVQPDAEVRIESIGGDLIVEASDGNEFRAGGDHPQIKIEEGGTRVTVACNGDCRLRVPSQVCLTIDSVGGDAKINAGRGPIRIYTNGSGLTFPETREAAVNSVGWSLKITLL